MAEKHGSNRASCSLMSPTNRKPRGVQGNHGRVVYGVDSRATQSVAHPTRMRIAGGVTLGDQARHTPTRASKPCKWQSLGLSASEKGEQRVLIGLSECCRQANGKGSGGVRVVRVTRRPFLTDWLHYKVSLVRVRHGMCAASDTAKCSTVPIVDE
jgi:hypothetical protein